MTEAGTIRMEAAEAETGSGKCFFVFCFFFQLVYVRTRYIAKTKTTTGFRLSAAASTT